MRLKRNLDVVASILGPMCILFLLEHFFQVSD